MNSIIEWFRSARDDGKCITLMDVLQKMHSSRVIFGEYDLEESREIIYELKDLAEREDRIESISAYADEHGLSAYKSWRQFTSIVVETSA